MRKLFFAPLIAVLLCLGFMPSPAQADTAVPDFFKNTNWWNKANPSYAEYNSGDSFTIYDESKWMYDKFPISCNNSTVNNRFRAYWVYPNDVNNRFPANNVYKALAAASSSIAASAEHPIANPGGLTLKQSYAPRWFTEEIGTTGNCRPKVDSIAVPREVLTRPSGTGTWHPYQTGELDDWLTAQGYRKANEKTLFLMQDFGHPNVGLKGIAENYTGTSENSWSPNRDVNRNNRGGTTLYAEYEPDHTNSYTKDPGYWGEKAKYIAHEMTHALGAQLTMGEGSPAVTHVGSDGHPTDCYDMLCYQISETETYSTSCGWTAGDDSGDQEATRATYRLDCNRDEYFTSSWVAWPYSWWNTAHSSFLWPNPQPVVAAAKSPSKTDDVKPNIIFN